MRWTWVSPLVVLASIAGCEAFQEEAAPPTPVKQEPDASAPDGAAPDSSLPPAPTADAGREEAGLADAGCGRFPSATFCDDFEAAAIGAAWQASGYGPNVTSGFVQPGFSGNKAFSLTVPKGESLVGSSIKQDRMVSKRIRTRAEVRIPHFAAVPGDYAGVFSVVLSTTPQVGVRVISRPSLGTVDLSVVNQGTGASLGDGSLQNVALSDWTAVDLEVTFGTSITSTLRVGSGVKAVSFDAPIPPSFNANVNVGIPFASSVGAETQVLLDDVAIWAE